MYKLVAFDMDGTLLNSEKKISIELGERKDSFSRSFNFNAPQFKEDELKQIVQSNNDFSRAIFVHQAETKENLVISPYSLYQALSMLYAGAAGETASEMRLAMRLP